MASWLLSHMDSVACTLPCSPHPHDWSLSQSLSFPTQIQTLQTLSTSQSISFYASSQTFMDKVPHIHIKPFKWLYCMLNTIDVTDDHPKAPWNPAKMAHFKSPMPSCHTLIQARWLIKSLEQLQHLIDNDCYINHTISRFTDNAFKWTQHVPLTLSYHYY